MNNKMQEAIAATQQDVIVAAEQKLGCSLTESERRGIQSIGSLMMLESCLRSFSSPAYTQAQVFGDLEHFTKQAQSV
jgi:hypothetical protein